MTNIVALDMFSGCGGLSTGLKQAGITIGWANELDKEACLTYRENHSETKVFEGNVTDYIQLIKERDSSTPRYGEVDLIVGGPPCQGFSGYNRYRHIDDPRNSLLDSFLFTVSLLKPRYVIMENVTGLLDLGDGKIIDLLLGSFNTLGYVAEMSILQAGYYGLPQNRWRVFIIARIEGAIAPEFPKPEFLFPRTTIFGAKAFRDNVIKPDTAYDRNNLKPYTTVGDAISDLPRIPNGGGVDSITYTKPAKSHFQVSARKNSNTLWNHIASNLGPVMYERCRAIPKKKGAGWLDLPDHLKPNNLSKKGDGRYNNRFGRLHWNGTFNTIVSKPEPYWGRVIHPSQNRVISIRESARAQGFPDTFRFYGTMKSQYLQVGNAVPPTLGRLLGESIIKAGG